MKPINISIAKPCTQDWEYMSTVSKQERSCEKCQQIIYDFSQMTDEELVLFFDKFPSTHCGRFHITQLDRDIFPLQKTGFRDKIRKIAAAIFTLISLKSHDASARDITTRSGIEFRHHDELSPDNPTSDSPIILDGKVLDERGKPIAGAVVRMDKMEVMTDTLGWFAFEIPGAENVERILTFSYKDFMKVVRNYHPVMGSTSYDVILIERKPGVHIMGMMMPSWNNIETPEIHFKSGFVLTRDQEICLGKLATDLQAHPTAPPLRITSFAKTPNQKRLVAKRMEQIEKFLINKAGMDNSRFEIVIDNSTNSDKVEFTFGDN